VSRLEQRGGTRATDENAAMEEVAAWLAARGNRPPPSGAPSLIHTTTSTTTCVLDSGRPDAPAGGARLEMATVGLSR